MIDTHAHAFPGVVAAASNALAGGNGGRARRQTVLSPVARTIDDVASRAANRLAPSRSVLEVETVSTVQRLLPSWGFNWFESVSALAVMPPAIVGGTVAGLLSSMSRHGITRTVLIGSRGAVSNRWLLEDACPQAPDRLIPVTTLPRVKAAAGVDEWTDAYRELAEAGTAGFKIHPNWDGLLPGHPSYDAAFEVAAEYDKFVIIHTGCFHVRMYRESKPLKLTDLRPYLDRYPDVRVCLAHMNREHPEVVWKLQREYEQVYTDTSWQPARVIRRAIDAVGSDRLMLGSDWPLLHLGLQRDSCRAVERAASGQDLENILDEAPKRFIGTGS